MVVPSALIEPRNSATALLLVGGTSPSPRIRAEMATSSSLALVAVGRVPKDSVRNAANARVNPASSYVLLASNAKLHRRREIGGSAVSAAEGIARPRSLEQRGM